MVAVGQECGVTQWSGSSSRLCPKIVLGVHQGCSHLEAWAELGVALPDVESILTLVADEAVLALGRKFLAPLTDLSTRLFQTRQLALSRMGEVGERQRDGQRQEKTDSNIPICGYLLTISDPQWEEKKSENKVLRFEGRNFKEFARDILKPLQGKGFGLS